MIATSDGPNAGLEAEATRTSDIHAGENHREVAIQDLVRAAVALDGAGVKKQ